MSTTNEPGFMHEPASPAILFSPPSSKAPEMAPWQNPDLLPVVSPEPHWRVMRDVGLAVVAEDELHRLMGQKPVPDKTDWHGKAFAPPVKGIRLIELVVPPGQERMIPAAECAELHADILARDQARFGSWREVNSQCFHSMLNSLMPVMLMLSGNFLWLVVLYLIGAANAHISARVALRQLLREPQRYLAASAANLRYGIWASSDTNKGKAFWRTIALTGGWLITFVVAKLVWETAGQCQGALDTAGLVKSRVLLEPWRLLTGAMLHASFSHLLLNVLSMFSLSMLLSRMTHYRLIIPVWLASALIGSLFSWWWLPAPSVGASGGVMGLFGCLLALGWHQRAWLPAMFMRNLLGQLGWLALIGVLMWSVIDNAAHAGGLLSGIVIGWWLFRTPRLAFPLRDSSVLRTIGRCAELLWAALLIFTPVKLLT